MLSFCFLSAHPLSNPSGACCLRAQLCLTLCNPRQIPVLGIILVRILESIAISFSRGSSRPRDWTCISYGFSIGRWILYHWVLWEAHPAQGGRILKKNHREAHTFGKCLQKEGRWFPVKLWLCPGIGNLPSVSVWLEEKMLGVMTRTEWIVEE